MQSRSRSAKIGSVSLTTGGSHGFRPHHRTGQRRTQIKNSIRSIFSQQGLTELLPRGKKAWSKAGIAQLREQAKLWAMLRTNTPWHEFGPPPAQTVT